jgi:hypothetical protein
MKQHVQTTEEQLVQDSEEPQPALPAPGDRQESKWAQKAEIAQEARALGQKIRKGKRVTFRNRWSMTR